MVAAELRVDAAGIAAVVLDVAFDRVVAFDQLRILAAGAREEAGGLADAGVALEIVLEIDRSLIGRQMLVAQVLRLLRGGNARGGRGFSRERQAAAKLPQAEPLVVLGSCNWAAEAGVSPLEFHS